MEIEELNYAVELYRSQSMNQYVVDQQVVEKRKIWTSNSHEQRDKIQFMGSQALHYGDKEYIL